MLLALTALFVLALAGIHHIERRGFEAIIASESDEHGRLLDAMLLHAGRPLRLFVTSYARRTSFTRPGETPRGASPEATLRTGLRTFDLDAAWVLEADGRVRLHVEAPGAEGLTTPPVTRSQLTALTSRTLTFYQERAGVLYRMRGSRLVADATHPDADRGWLFAAKRWDAAELAAPEFLIEGRLTLVSPNEAGAPTSERHPVRIERILRDANQQPVRVLRLDYRPDEVEILAGNVWFETLVMLAFGVASFGVVIFCLTRWVLLPATTIQRILAARDVAALAPLRERGGYLARMADLVHQLLTTQDNLEKNLAERVRLGRELHDGAIQTIYAAGMGIASARATLRDNPAGAERLLDETRAELNATIVDLRTFIGNLEPEAVPKRTLSEAIRASTALIESAQKTSFEIVVDEVAAAALPACHQMHILQIVREAVSNAVRHGQAGRISVTLRRDETALTAEIVDDGVGLGSRDTIEFGRGLANFQARAAELGGTIAIESVAPRGVRVRLSVPPAR